MADPVPSSRRADDAVSLGEVVEYVKTYAKQETIGPLRGAGRWLAYGAAGALTLGLGAFFLLLGVLRLVQTEWDRAATGRLSWLAYLIVFLLTLAALALTLSRIRKSSLYPTDDRSSRQEASR